MRKRLLIYFIVFFLGIAYINIPYEKKVSGKIIHEDDVKIGMVTAAADVDDKSFNQSMWEGIEKASKDFKIEATYIKPIEPTESEYSRAISDLVNNGYNLIITSGSLFESTIYKAQEKYKNIDFILLDATPSPGGIAKGKSIVGKNTICLIFAENEGGFLAGVATALQLKQGNAGFIGGMEVETVQKFNWGFQQGVKYANDNFGTSVIIKPDNVKYLSSFRDIEGCRKLASEMYNRGVNVIFTAAGNAGIGAIEEAKKRASSGKNVWIVGVDKDQYDVGIYSGNKSVILTSAVKAIDKAVYNVIKETVESGFKGGRVLRFDSKNGGVGLPKINPNLSEDTMKKVEEIYEKVKSGEIKVGAEKDELIQ